MAIASENRPLDSGDELLTAAVVIATRSRPALLDRCISAVIQQSVSPTVVVVVDNSDGDDATRAVAGHHGAHYVVEPRRGVSRARNTGAHVCRTDVVAYLDDDAVPDPEWLSALLGEFRDPHVAAVTGRILEIAQLDAGPTSPRAEAGQRIAFGGQARLMFDRNTPEWFERANFGGVGQGANLAIRRAASWPGFDERLGAGTTMVGTEEHHAFFSLIDQGYRVVYTPAASVYHPYPDSDAEVRSLRLRQVASTTAHLVLLLSEEKRYRRRTAKYGLQVLAGRHPTWRTPPLGPHPGAWSIARARLRGVAMYVRTRVGIPVRGDSA